MRKPAAERIRLGRSALPGLLAMWADSGRSFARHTHDLFGIGLIDRGGQRSASGRGMVEALRGDVITVNPGEVHDGHALQGKARAWRMLYLEPALFGDGDRRTLEFTRPAVRATPALRRSFDAVFAEAVGEGEGLALESGVLALLAQAPTQEQPRALRSAPAAIERARARLGAPDLPVPSLAELAHEAALSRFQLLRAFACAYGLPPHVWLQQQRLARARGFIAQGLALADAAAMAGYSDQSHMTRSFVRCLGFTPGAYAAVCGSR